MNMSSYRATFAVIAALAMLSPATSSLAQQQAVPAAEQAPVLSPAVLAQAAQPVQAPAPSAAGQSTPAVAATDVSAAPVDGGRSLKSTTVALRELSPWSMFLSADILVKAVMIGLAFASLVTWTVFLAKMIELSLVQRKLRAALGKISDARSLAEAQFALGAKGSVLSALLSAAMREARLSAGVSSDSGIKERAASSFAEIVRAEARRIRLGMVAAIPAVIIYNHFSRVTKGYLELVSRSSGAAGRLLSRDLDRTHVSAHGGTHSRAAE